MTALLSQRQGRGLGRGRVRRNQFLVVLIASVLWHEIGALSYSIGSNSKSLLIDGGAYATFKQYPQSFTGADDNSIGQLTYTIGYSVDGNNDRVLAVPVNPNDDNAKEVEDILVNRNVVRVYKDTICKVRIINICFLHRSYLCLCVFVCDIYRCFCGCTVFYFSHIRNGNV